MPPAAPPGVICMEFFSMASQTAFNAIAGENITVQQPWIMIPKADILAEAQKKGAISDWFPFKGQVEKIKEDDVMLVWCEELPEEFMYAEEWYFAGTTKARESLLERLAEYQATLAPVKEEKAPGAEGEEGDEEGSSEEEEEDYEIPEVREGPLFRSEGGWTDQGSEAEMEDARTKNSRPFFKYAFSKPRRDFGAPVKFNFHDADIDDMNAAVAQAKEKKLTKQEEFEKEPEKIVPRKQMDFSFQVTKVAKEVSTQTAFAQTRNFGVLYKPISMDSEKAKEELKAESMTNFLRTVWPRYETALLMNASADIYEDDLTALVDGEDQMQGNSKGDQIKEAYSFQDLVYSKNKQIVCIDWHEPGKGTLGCAYVQKLDFQQRVDKLGLVDPAVVLVWDFADNINPQYILEGPSDMFCFRFNPTDPDWVVAGCISGQVVVWNLKTGHKAPTTFAEQLAMDKPEGNKSIVVEVTDFSPSLCETSHRRPVTDLCWLPPELEFGTDGGIIRNEDGKTHQFATVSGDGTILIWDIHVKKDSRRPDKEPIWNPTFKFQLKGLSGDIHGGCQLSVVDLGDGAKFVCTTESGDLITGVWKKMKGEATLDDEEGDGPFVQSVAAGHFGTCQTLQVSPFFSDIWLTVGDWRFNVWKDGVEEPIFSSPFQPCRVTCARWSPNRPSVIFVGREDGVMDVWDFLDRSHEPLTNVPFTQPIVSMEFPKSKVTTGLQAKDAGHFLGVGDDAGMCHVMKLPRMYTRPSRIEEKTIKGIFDREVARVDYIKRRTEFRIDERGKLESQAGAEDDAGPDPAVVAKEMEDAEKQFQKLKEQFEKDMGLNEEEEEDA